MLKNLLILPALLLLLFAPPAQAADAGGQPVIGRVVEVEGNATITMQGQAYKAVRQSAIHMHDVIATGTDTKMLVLFIDKTQITLGQNAKLTVDEYVYNPKDDTNNKGTYSILEGSFKYVSGLLAKKENPDVNINTSYGNIGIRGTQLHCGKVKDTYGVVVNEGRVRVRNDGGEVYVDRGKATMIKSRREKPSAAGAPPKEFMEFLGMLGVFKVGPAGISQLLGVTQNGLDPQALMKGIMNGDMPLKNLKKNKSENPLDGFNPKKNKGGGFNPLNMIPR